MEFRQMIDGIWIVDIQNMDRWYMEYGQMVYGMRKMIYGIWIDGRWNLDR